MCKTVTISISTRGDDGDGGVLAAMVMAGGGTASEIGHPSGHQRLQQGERELRCERYLPTWTQAAKRNIDKLADK